ncbi:hypothetical protein SAMN05421823_11118 [Catalinimonas alkaloidigena]|uniref:Lipoprotein n=1 Tax=Catalinimonas alkaloidigena TaxID=1075417 RepID=A0A1G9R3B2_9BACT|nr:hypothetical protein [Catalinimonas alkaloidigena]SDM17744.1 hypothetical protein SAMN05421823_11118 [Catalinimonas alkaloidigena]
MRHNKLIAFTLWGFITLLLLTGCDPSHDLRLENRTNEQIEVIYAPHTNDIEELPNRKISRINVNGRATYRLVLKSSEMIKIGFVSARYIPKPSDVHLDYLELRLTNDTLMFSGKNAIFSAIQEVENLDWRLIIRKEFP